MLILGRVEPIDRVAFLDASVTPWWQEQCRLTRVKAARELMAEKGRPSHWFGELLQEGMRRLAGRLPCVDWCLGPLRIREERRVLGLWPVHAEIHKRIKQRRVVVIDEEVFDAGLPRPCAGAQQHWLVIRGHGYKLVSVTGKAIWYMVREKWEGYHVYGEVVWSLASEVNDPALHGERE